MEDVERISAQRSEAGGSGLGSLRKPTFRVAEVLNSGLKIGGRVTCLLSQPSGAWLLGKCSPLSDRCGCFIYHRDFGDQT